MIADGYLRLDREEWIRVMEKRSAPLADQPTSTEVPSGQSASSQGIGVGRTSLLPEIDLARIHRWVNKENERIPPHARDDVRIELDIDARSVTILECRPPWDPDRMGPEWTRSPVARLRYTRSRHEWSLYWPDRHSRLHLYDLTPPTADVGTLLEEIDRDPTSIFWG